MKTIRSLLLLATSLVLTAAAFAADPSGQWKWTNTGPQGRTMEATLDLKVADGKVSGTVTGGRGGPAPIADAKLEGDQLSFTVTRKMREREVTVRYSGKVEGNTIKGKMNTTGREDRPIELDWVATR